MRRVTKRIKPTANMRRKVRAKGSVVVCRQGGWPTHRIHFEEPSAEPFRDASSQPLVNGEVYLASEPDGFVEFWVSTNTVHSDPEDIILDVIDCATPVVELGRPFGGFEYHVVLATDGTPIGTEGEEWFKLYGDEVWASDLSDGIIDTTRHHVMPRGFIGGGVSANRQFQLHLYEVLSYRGATNRALIAAWIVENEDRDGRYSCSLQFGGLPGFRAHWDDVGHSSTGNLMWPMLGLELYLKPVSSADVEVLLYERIPR